MSITIEQQPDKFSPVFNPMNFVASSDELVGNDFFFFLLYVKDENGDPISQHRYSPRPDNSYILFDVSRMLEKYVSYDISGIVSGTTGVRYASDVYQEYTVQFIEEYGASASGIASGATTTSATKYAVNASFRYNDYTDYTQTDWVIASGSTKKFLTDMRGADIRIKESQRFELGMMTDAGATQPVKNITIKTYETDGTLIGTYKIANAYAAGTTSADKFLSVLVGTGDLNSTTLASGSQPVITSAVDHYTVYVENNSGDACSETLTFKIDRRCYRTDGIRLYWLNSLGRIDAFNFNFANDRSIDIARAQFRKITGSFTGAAYGYTKSERGTSSFFTQVNDKIKVRTDYINNTEAEWLENLASSPAIWGEIDGHIVSLEMDTSSYTLQTIEKNGVFIAEFDLSFANPNYRQRL